MEKGGKSCPGEGVSLGCATLMCLQSAMVASLMVAMVVLSQVLVASPRGAMVVPPKGCCGLVS